MVTDLLARGLLARGLLVTGLLLQGDHLDFHRQEGLPQVQVSG